MTCVFIFRRDLRLVDNLGLLEATQNYDTVLPCFIFTPEQITEKNQFRSHNAIQFMCESLQELDGELRTRNSQLHYFQGENIKVLDSIHQDLHKSGKKLDAIVCNQDYTPYAKKRDSEIEKWCQSNEVKCHLVEDYLLAPVGSIVKGDGNPYTVFTPFKNTGFKVKVAKVNRKLATNFGKFKFSKSLDKIISYQKNENILVSGGRMLGKKQMQKLKNQNQYNTTRNSLSLETSHLSAYLKFGCVSIREVYHKIKKLYGLQNNLLDQLFWREFYFYIAHYFPQVLKGKNYNPKYDKVKWTVNKVKFEKWCQGKTGFPVVDAGMRQLNDTGYMHNRARLITSNFLNRMLGMDWRLGEKYFAQMLTDYDPSVNNGNWQWIASTGTDPKPYFQRLFNPMLQSQKFDSDASYIKKWLPELEEVPAKHLHDWNKHYSNYNLAELNYVAPIVDYKEARKESVEMYRAVL